MQTLQEANAMEKQISCTKPIIFSSSKYTDWGELFRISNKFQLLLKNRSYWSIILRTLLLLYAIHMYIAVGRQNSMRWNFARRYRCLTPVLSADAVALIKHIDDDDDDDDEAIYLKYLCTPVNISQIFDNSSALRMLRWWWYWWWHQKYKSNKPLWLVVGPRSLNTNAILLWLCSVELIDSSMLLKSNNFLLLRYIRSARVCKMPKTEHELSLIWALCCIDWFW